MHITIPRSTMLGAGRMRFPRYEALLSRRAGFRRNHWGVTPAGYPNPLTGAERDELLSRSEHHRSLSRQHGDTSDGHWYAGRAFGESEAAHYYGRKRLKPSRYIPNSRRRNPLTKTERATILGYAGAAEAEADKFHSGPAKHWSDTALSSHWYNKGRGSGFRSLALLSRIRPNPLARGRKSRARFTHKRLASPSKFARGSFRTIRLPRGRRLVIGCPKGHWDARAKRCRVGTRAQSILRPKRGAKMVRRIKRGGRRMRAVANPMTQITLESSSMIHTPGILRWAKAGYPGSRGKSRAAIVQAVSDGYHLPRRVAIGLLTGKIPYRVEGDKVVFTADVPSRWKPNSRRRGAKRRRNSMRYRRNPMLMSVLPNPGRRKARRARRNSYATGIPEIGENPRRRRRGRGRRRARRNYGSWGIPEVVENARRRRGGRRRARRNSYATGIPEIGENPRRKRRRSRKARRVSRRRVKRNVRRRGRRGSNPFLRGGQWYPKKGSRSAKRFMALLRRAKKSKAARRKARRISRRRMKARPRRRIVRRRVSRRSRRPARFRKGSLAAKRYMAKLRAMIGRKRRRGGRRFAANSRRRRSVRRNQWAAWNTNPRRRKASRRRNPFYIDPTLMNPRRRKAKSRRYKRNPWLMSVIP